MSNLNTSVKHELLRDVDMADATANPKSQEQAGTAETDTTDTCSRRSSKRRCCAFRSNHSNSADHQTSKKSKTCKSKPVVSKKDQEQSDMAWICVACREAECAIDPNSDLLFCEGPCRRLFHSACAGLAQVPSDDEIWQCHNCVIKKHHCSFCQDLGQDNEDVFKCQKPDCGMFFHEGCLEMQNIPIMETDKGITAVSTIDAPASPDDNDEGYTEGGLLSTATGEAPKTLKFTCPAHWCWTCTQDDMFHDAAAPNDGSSKIKSKGRRKKKKMTNAFASKKGSRLFPCLECPLSYHLTCIPPSAKFHELALLCHEHASTKELPALNVASSLQGNMEAAADEKLQKMQNRDNLLAKRAVVQHLVYNKSRGKGSRNPFFPSGVVADRRTDNEQMVHLKISEQFTDTTTTDAVSSASLQGTINEFEKSSNILAATNMLLGEGSRNDRLLFCLPADVQEEVHAKPPPYKHIHSLKYYSENRPKKIPMPEDICNCVDFCDDHCINRLLYVECFGSKEGNSGEASCRTTNCRVGPNCGNRRLGMRQHVKKCKPKTEKGKGWGLMTMENISKDNLVQEYLGDVIDEKTKEQRLKDWSIEHPNDPNFYIMCLSQGWYIDAREHANLSRFINHSCDPNCILTRLNVNGYMRDGIFALRDIKAGEFLSYDYHFDTKLGDKFICRCGSNNCRGTMMETHLKKDTAKKTKSELWSEAKQRLEKDKDFLRDFEARELRNLTVQEVVPGATKAAPPTGSATKETARQRNGEGTAKKQEWVSNGIQDKDRTNVIRSRIFLWRNAVVGSDFAARWGRYSVAGKDQSDRDFVVRTKSTRRNEVATSSPAKAVDIVSFLAMN